MRALSSALLLLVVGSCASPRAQVHVEGEHLELVRELLRTVPGEPLTTAGGRGGAGSITVVADLDCTECYRVERVRERVVVHGDAPLGIQYGLTATLEAMGYRFFHPWAGVEGTFELPPEGHPIYERQHEPAIAQRGLQLHTLHPIEGYWDLWQPGEAELEAARRDVDWIVKQRGNYLQWVGLDNVLRPRHQEAWRAHTSAIVDYAHSRGVRVGFAIQLFGGANLQKAFDLVESPEVGPVDAEASIRRRIEVFADLGFDEINVNFGEFSEESPEDFLLYLDLAVRVIREVTGAEITATVHVGADLRVEYMGEEQIYYFLVRHASEPLVPWVHTVMYYSMQDPTNGAYHHDDFGEHRQLILDTLETDTRVVYFPETAYWVALDNPVPVYMPLYQRARFADLVDLAEAGARPLDGHVLFSSGWEWGYWQNDYATLRATYEPGEDWGAAMDEAFAVYENGDELSGLIESLGELQHDVLVEAGLGAYYGGIDGVIELGFELGVVGQPDRVGFDDLAAMEPAALQAFENEVLRPLALFAAGTRVAADRIARAVGDRSDPFLRELVDAFEIDALRAEFVVANYEAAWRSLTGEGRADFDAVDALLEAAEQVVARRGDALFHPMSETLRADRAPNATLYQYGYLREAHQLCFWRRERAIARNQILGASEDTPTCVL